MQKINFSNRSEKWRISLYQAGVLFVTLAMLAQAVVTFQSYSLPWTKDVIQLLGAPSWKRAGYLSQWLGKEPTDYLGFLREQIPTEAVVLIPRSHEGVYTQRPLIQYYLFPREIVSCRSQEIGRCVEEQWEATGVMPYILKLSSFPGIDFSPTGYRIIQYERDLELYVPELQ
jgi:hypothetical protein